METYKQLFNHFRKHMKLEKHSYEQTITELNDWLIEEKEKNGDDTLDYAHLEGDIDKYYVRIDMTNKYRAIIDAIRVEIEKEFGVCIDE